MRGKEYMAPCTGLQRMPGTALKTCSVSLALAARSASTACFSCGRRAHQAWVQRPPARPLTTQPPPTPLRSPPGTA